jgi:hypothetical protein
MDMMSSDSILSQASSEKPERGVRQPSDRASNREAACLSDGRNVTEPVQNPDDNDLAWTKQVIDSVLLMENHAQIGRKTRPRRTGKWQHQCLANPGLKARQKSGCD